MLLCSVFILTAALGQTPSDSLTAAAGLVAQTKVETISPKDTLPVYRVKGVTVIATRMPLPELIAPASVTVVEPEPVDPTARPTTILGQSPSAIFAYYGGQGSLSSLSLRGSASTDVLYMLDGTPLNLARDGTFDLNQLPPGITKIEVLRGPAAALYGANAAAGAINFITEQPIRDKPYSKIRYQQGSFGHRTLEGMFSRNLYRHLGLEASASWEKSDGQRINSDYDGLKYSFYLNSRPSSEIEGQAHYRFYKSENGNPGSITWPTPLERQQDRQEDLGLKVRYRFLGLSTSRIRTQRKVLADYGITENQSQKRQAELNAQWELWKKLHLQAGLSHQEDRDISTASGDHSLDQTSAFLSQSLILPLNLLLSTSMRFDYTQTYPSQLSPNIALGWTFLNRLSFHLAYGRSYRAPSLVDLYWPIEVYPPYLGLATKISGNPKLKPESSRQWEIGTKYEISWLKASASVYQRRTRDLIDWTNTVFLPPDTSYTYPENLGKVMATGFESSLAISPLSWLILEGSYAYCRTIEDTVEGKILPYRPLNTASASFKIEGLQIAPNLRLGWKLSLRYTDRQTVRHETAWSPGLELPRFLVADQTVSLKIRDARIFYSTENLNNAEYQTRYGYPMPRRSHIFGLVMELWD